MSDLQALAVAAFRRRPRWEVPAGSGVVSACDAGYFKGFQLLYASLALSHRVDVLLVDLGLTPAQRLWAARQPGLFVVRFPPGDLAVPATESMWQAWNKPLYLARSPFRLTLWLDADTLVLPRVGLAPAFGHLGRQPLLLSQEGGGRNEEALYRALPVPGRREDFRLTSGVVGFDTVRDRGLLASWGSLTARVAAGGLLDAVNFWDEGVLRLAVQLGGHYGLVWPDEHWTRLVHGHLRRPTLAADLAGLAERWPEDYVLHFYGRPKAWAATPGGLLEIEPHEDP